MALFTVNEHIAQQEQPLIPVQVLDVLGMNFTHDPAARYHEQVVFEQAVFAYYDLELRTRKVADLNLAIWLALGAGGTDRLSEEARGGAPVAAEEQGALAGRDALGRFTGAGGYGAKAEARGLSEYELATGQTVIRGQVRATLSDGSIRYYDGLVRNPDGTYTGIEVKSGSASLSSGQRAFDAAVNGGEAASATLNGRPIEITSTDLVRVR